MPNKKPVLFNRRKIPQSIEPEDLGGLFIDFYKEHRDGDDQMNRKIEDICKRLDDIEKYIHTRKDWPKVFKGYLQSIWSESWKYILLVCLGAFVTWLWAGHPGI